MYVPTKAEMKRSPYYLEEQAARNAVPAEELTLGLQMNYEAAKKILDTLGEIVDYLAGPELLAKADPVPTPPPLGTLALWLRQSGELFAIQVRTIDALRRLRLKCFPPEGPEGVAKR